MSTEAYLSDFKLGYADGFSTSVAALGYPDQSAMVSDTRAYQDGFSQGYADGEAERSTLRSQLCGNARISSVTTGPSYYPASSYPRYSSYSRSPRIAAVTPARPYYRAPQVRRGMGTRARQALMIAGGAAAGAGVGGAIGGKKGALIGALVGGGTGTALAVTKQPRRAYNRRVTGKDVLTKSLLGAGAGAAIGALAGGKRGALAGAAAGGGGGALWSVMTGKRTTPRY
jgi:hypothetical protein